MGSIAGAIAPLRVNTPLRIEITDDARTQIAAAAAWWAEHRPAATGAVLEDLDRILGLLAVQPAMGARARRTSWQECGESSSLEFGTTCITE